ncbi:MAG: META domain-containing protein [Bacteroidia bacterium]|nr:META domain-containing protein [Bacteroidia bacterium]
MKKTIVLMSLVGVAIFLFSCRSTEKLLSSSSINGEWDIVEINGVKVIAGDRGHLPFIGFDGTQGRIYGNSGCNRMMGTFKLNVKPGSLDFGPIASTRMACPDMTTEQNVLNILSQVKTYQLVAHERLLLCNGNKRPVALLQRKVKDVSILSGEWLIKEINGVVVTTQTERLPFLNFDVKEQRVHGNPGCNVVNGAFKTEPGKPSSLSFSNLASTMMACPDLKVEDEILKAMEQVRSFSEQSAELVGLCDATGKVLLLLEKK